MQNGLVIPAQVATERKPIVEDHHPITALRSTGVDGSLSSYVEEGSSPFSAASWPDPTREITGSLIGE